MLQRQRAAAEAQQADLLQHREALLVRAPLDGIWISAPESDLLGALAHRGRLLGQIVQPPRFEFVAVIPQADSARLFAYANPPAEIRLAGQAAEAVPVDRVNFIPGRQSTLPTAALGWSAGGPVKVQTEDREGLRTAEPYFEAIAEVRAGGPVALLHGQTGFIRFTTGSEPLLVQGWRRFRQLLQQRYQI